MKPPTRARGVVKARLARSVARPPKGSSRTLSIKSIVSRQMFWSIQDQLDAQEQDQQRQQDQLSLLHQDVLPNWDSGPSPVASTDLNDSSDNTQASGTGLGVSGSLPPDFVPPPIAQ